MLVYKEFVHLWCAWNQGCAVSSSSLFPVMLFIDLLEHKAITKLHKSWRSTYLAAFFQIACLLFHLKSSGFFCNKDLPGCLLWRKWLCWSCAGHWHWKWCGEACCCSSWESLIKKWSWPCFLTAHRQAEGCLCLSYSFSWVCSAPKYCFRWCLAQPECCC